MRLLRTVSLLAPLALATAASAVPTDYPLLGRMPGYEPGGYEERAFDEADFTVKKGDETETQTIAGRRVSVLYTLAQGKPAASDLEIQRNYRNALKKLGAELLFEDDRSTDAVLHKDGKEIWLEVHSSEQEIDLTVIEKGDFKPSLRKAEPPDHPLLGRMPNYEASPPESRDFDAADFTVKNGDEETTVTVEGARFSIAYMLKDGVDPSSDVEIQRNYRARLAELGADILDAESRDTDARILADGKEYFVTIHSQETEIDITLIEKKEMQQTLQEPKLDEMRQALAGEGRLALYVNFDTGKATLKPDAAPVLDKVSALLKENPGWHIRIEGHTDIIGTAEGNKTLSEARAKAVAAALTKAGVAASRLDTVGFGQEQPVADNGTEEGRAKNRRVELVKE